MQGIYGCFDILGTGRFEVIDKGTSVVTGYVRAADNPSDEMIDPSRYSEKIEEQEMKKKDIYQELRLRGYHYSGLFCGLKSCNTQGTMGEIIWANNWVAFMDNILQIKILGTDTRGLFVPTGISKLVIDAKHQLYLMKSLSDGEKGKIYTSFGITFNIL